MMLVKFNTAADKQSRLALDDGTALYDLSARYPSLRSFLEVYPDLQDGGAYRDFPVVARDVIRCTIPVDEGSHIYLVGANYKTHAVEAGLDVPLTPVIFQKPSTALVGGGEPILLPPISSQMDYEGELAVVIGRTASRVPKSEAHRYVAGLTIVNDVTARDLQWVMLGKNRIVDWLSSKSLDKSTPIGPGVVPAGSVPDIHRLGIKTWLNGNLMQDGNTSMMVFSTYELIEFLSARVTLRPGDVISTGTPYGVGGFRNIFLKPGDVLEVQIEGVGKLTNPILQS